jgi:hypothetical protein
LSPRYFEQPRVLAVVVGDAAVADLHRPGRGEVRDRHAVPVPAVDVVGRVDVAEAEPLSRAGQSAAGQIGKDLRLWLCSNRWTSASSERFCAVDGGTEAQSFLGDEEIEGVAADAAGEAGEPLLVEVERRGRAAVAVERAAHLLRPER